MQQDSYDLTAITETAWDDFHDWSAAVGAYKLFRRNRQGWRSSGFAVYVREYFDCIAVSDWCA